MKRKALGTFTAVFVKRDRWYVGYVEELPGVNTQGRTLAEVRRNLKEALRLIVDTNRSLGSKPAAGTQIREPISLEA